MSHDAAIAEALRATDAVTAARQTRDREVELGRAQVQQLALQACAQFPGGGIGSDQQQEQALQRAVREQKELQARHAQVVADAEDAVTAAFALVVSVYQTQFAS